MNTGLRSAWSSFARGQTVHYVWAQVQSYRANLQFHLLIMVLFFAIFSLSDALLKASSSFGIV